MDERIILNTMKMLWARGCEIELVNENHLIAQRYIEDDKKNSFSSKILIRTIVQFYLHQKFSVVLLSSVVQHFKQYDEIIVVCESIMKKNLEKAQDNNIEVFTRSQLSIHILENTLQPSFKKIVPKDLGENYRQFVIHLPQMKRSDPVAKLMNFKEGDVIEITTKQGRISYRIVTL